MTFGHLRRGALLLVASALAVGPFVAAIPAGAATTSCAPNSPCIHITFPDGGLAPVDVPASQLDTETDILNTTYDIRYANGGTTTDTITGVSVRKLLGSIDPSDPGLASQATFVYIRNPLNGYESPLQPGDLADPSPFEYQLEPAFDVQGLDAGIEYIRPLRNAEDVNGTDRFQTASVTDTIDLQVYTSDALRLHPSVSVGAGPWKPHDNVTFSASLPNAPPHDGVTYSWTFASGDTPGPATASSTTAHRYQQNDSYSVTVAVAGTGPDGQTYTGQSTPVTVQVGPVQHRKPGGGRTGGNGGAHKTHPTSGPTKASGHHQGSAPTGGPTVAPTPTTAPATPTASDGITPASDGVVPTSTSTSAGAVATAGHTATGAGQAVSGALVQGVLIDPSAGAISARASAATRAAASARRPARLHTSLDPRWLWMLVPVALVVAGALGERRRVPHRHGRQSRT